MADKYQVAFYNRSDLSRAALFGGQPPLFSLMVTAPEAPAAMRSACNSSRLVTHAVLMEREEPAIDNPHEELKEQRCC